MNTQEVIDRLAEIDTDVSEEEYDDMEEEDVSSESSNDCSDESSEDNDQDEAVLAVTTARGRRQSRGVGRGRRRGGGYSENTRCQKESCYNWKEIKGTNFLQFF